MSVTQKPFIVFFTGASGAGKTTLVNALKKEIASPSIAYFHFDSIGVPSEEMMVKIYGSGSEWQKAMTYWWVERFIREFSDKHVVIFEGQVNLQFIVSAFEKFAFTQYQIVLVHCELGKRHQRLYHERLQPELVNQTMDNWSNYLKKQALDMQAPILDTTDMHVDDMIKWVKQHFNVLIG